MKIKLYLFTPFLISSNLSGQVSVAVFDGDTGSINADIIAGIVNTVDNVSFLSDFTAETGVTNITNANAAPFSQTVNLTDISPTVDGEGVVGFFLGLDDIFDHPPESTLEITVTTGLGNLFEFVVTEELLFDGAFPRNGNVLAGDGDFTYSTRLNGGEVTTSVNTFLAGNNPINYFEATTTGDTISSVSFTFIGNPAGAGDNDRVTFEGIAFSTIAIPEPSIAFLSTLAMVSFFRRKRSARAY